MFLGVPDRRVVDVHGGEDGEDVGLQEGDEHLETDTVFGSAGSLVAHINDNDPNSPMANMPAIHFDFKLP